MKLLLTGATGFVGSAIQQRIVADEHYDLTVAVRRVVAVLLNAPGNGAAIGGIKVCTENGWFAARPSGTEALYKIYAESFINEAHLQLLIDEAQGLLAEVL